MCVCGGGGGERHINPQSDALTSATRRPVAALNAAPASSATEVAPNPASWCTHTAEEL